MKKTIHLLILMMFFPVMSVNAATTSPSRAITAIFAVAALLVLGILGYFLLRRKKN